MNPFIHEITNYLAANSNSRFTFGTGNSNLKVGELTQQGNGVFTVSSPSPNPNLYLPVETHLIDFWARNKSSVEAYDDLLFIYNLFHQAHHYNTDNWEVFFSYAGGQVVDTDRDGEGRKVLRLSVVFITRNLIS